ncbi:MAG: hypothetical protein H6868_01145 [Rhodospirillales bacterium]|nr:hypothetical protein [Rhodospirillales bacterium]
MSAVLDGRDFGIRARPMADLRRAVRIVTPEERAADECAVRLDDWLREKSLPLIAYLPYEGDVFFVRERTDHQVLSALLRDQARDLVEEVGLDDKMVRTVIEKAVEHNYDRHGVSVTERMQWKTPAPVRYPL